MQIFHAGDKCLTHVHGNKNHSFSNVWFASFAHMTVAPLRPSRFSSASRRTNFPGFEIQDRLPDLGSRVVK